MKLSNIQYWCFVLLFCLSDAVAQCNDLIFEAESVEDATNSIFIEYKTVEIGLVLIPYREIAGDKFYFECKLAQPVNYFAISRGDFDASIHLYIEAGGGDSQNKLKWNFQLVEKGFVKLGFLENTDKALRVKSSSDGLGFILAHEAATCVGEESLKSIYSLSVNDRERWFDGQFPANESGVIDGSIIAPVIESTFNDENDTGLLEKTGLLKQFNGKGRELISCFYYAVIDNGRKIRNAKIQSYVEQEKILNAAILTRETAFLNLEEQLQELREIYWQIASLFKQVVSLDKAIKANELLKENLTERYRSLVVPHSVRGMLITTFDEDLFINDDELLRRTDKLIDECSIGEFATPLMASMATLQDVVRLDKPEIASSDYKKQLAYLKRGRLAPTVDSGKIIRFSKRKAAVAINIRYMPPSALKINDNKHMDNSEKTADCAARAGVFWLKGNVANLLKTKQALAAIFNHEREKIDLARLLQEVDNAHKRIETDNDSATALRDRYIGELKSELAVLVNKIEKKEQDKRRLLGSEDGKEEHQNEPYQPNIFDLKRKAKEVHSDISSGIALLRDEFCEANEGAKCVDLLSERYCSSKPNGVLCAINQLYERKEDVVRLTQYRDGVVFLSNKQLASVAGADTKKVVEEITRGLEKLERNATETYMTEVNVIVGVGRDMVELTSRLSGKGKFASQRLRLYLQEVTNDDGSYVYFVLELLSKLMVEQDFWFKNLLEQEVVALSRLLEFESKVDGWLSDIEKAKKTQFIDKNKEAEEAVAGIKTASLGAKSIIEQCSETTDLEWLFVPNDSAGSLYVDIQRLRSGDFMSFLSKYIDGQWRLPTVCEINSAKLKPAIVTKLKANNINHLFTKNSKLGVRLFCAKFAIKDNTIVANEQGCDKGERIRLLLVKRK